ncbi:ERF family protein [Paucibacter sp. O1-1]|nr:ERF family protein [Paucibacter sp. O1-1]MDA3827812.1 ERF family protein [Paucibacter sp. O1-1]
MTASKAVRTPARKTTPKKSTAPAAAPTPALAAPLAAKESVAALSLRLIAGGVPAAMLQTIIEATKAEEAAAAARAYGAAFVRFQAKGVKLIKSIHVERETDDGEAVDYWYAPLPEVIDAVQPALHECGLAHSFRVVEQTTDWLTVACRLTHTESGHFEEVALGGPPDHTGDKSGAQAVASTNTLLQRLTLKAACGLAEKHDDTDGRLGNRTSAKPKAKDTKTAKAAPAVEFMDAGDFARSMTSWRKLLLSGQRCADDIVAMAKTRKPLSPEQEKEVRSVEAMSPVEA